MLLKRRVLKIKKYLKFKWKWLIIVLVVILFITINSTQQRYISLDSISSSTLETVYSSTSSNVVTSSDETTNFTTPSFPYSNPNQNVQSSHGLPSFVVPLLIVGSIVMVIILLIKQKKKYTVGSPNLLSERVSNPEERKKLFTRQIIYLENALEEFLRRGNYSEGIIYGYQEMDRNMKKLLGINRASYLTPKEFAVSLNLPEVVQQFKEIVDLFYRARYRIDVMARADLQQFIHDLQTIKQKSKVAQPIRVAIIDSIEQGDGNNKKK